MAAARRGTSLTVPVRPARSEEFMGLRRALLTKPSLVLADKRW